ncbi:aminotransferase class IV [Methylobacterium organophilum]|uniref:aminotransferase class IV n=1 Tax=Methylobacterium organophilum TaxID=410 RepID=UPI001F130F2C|nr:aminotransferase class IV [Methylobacterium organophilum]UMY16848.1 aminotransferase class IV [Methylobacterium organophilum]
MLWFDGRPTEGKVPFDLADRGLLLGDGVFDTALALEGRIAFEEAHIARLVAAAATLGFAVAPETIRAAMRGLAAGEARAGIRTTVTRGVGPRGILPPETAQPIVFASSAPLAPNFAAATLTLRTTGIARNETSPTSRLKTLGYLDAVLAIRESRAAGFDEALFLNTRGRVACAGTGNLVALSGDRLITPPLGEGVLAGILRGVLGDLAPNLGLVWDESPLTPEALKAAEAVFLTNSLRLVCPVTRIDDTILGSAGHPRLRQLAEAVRRATAASCGVDPGRLP